MLYVVKWVSSQVVFEWEICYLNFSCKIHLIRIWDEVRVLILDRLSVRRWDLWRRPHYQQNIPIHLVPFRKLLVENFDIFVVNGIYIRKVKKYVSRNRWSLEVNIPLAKIASTSKDFVLIIRTFWSFKFVDQSVLYEVHSLLPRYRWWFDDEHSRHLLNKIK